ncbi:MAG: ABC transporter permease [Anaerolineales bacterium]
MRFSHRKNFLFALAPFLLTLLFGTVLLLLSGANPLEAYGHLLSGAFESPRKWADIAVAMVPLVLCSSGMVITFAAGLWNIGIEGQMIAGALLTTWVVQQLVLPSYLLLPICIVAGLIGGGLWGLLVGLLRTHGQVNEIFGGLGLNFIATALTNYLIFGPWKPPDGATMSGTDPFPPRAWMPLLGNTRASLVSICFAVVSLLLVYFLLRDTYWGLELKAIGLNARASHRMGINTSGNMLKAFVACGALAGLAGCFQATAVHRRLIPGISSGYGYLSILVVLLSGLKVQWVAPVVFFFGAIQVASPRLELRMQLDSSLGGILQTGMVLFFLLARGFGRFENRRNVE